MNPLSNHGLHVAAQSLAADSRSLDQLKREAASDPHAAVKKAATQFEALFMQMVLKSMRDATPKAGLFGDDSAQQMYTSMLDQQLAVKMASSGTGLADVIARQLTRHLAPGAESAANATGAAAAGAPAEPVAPRAANVPATAPPSPACKPEGTPAAAPAGAPSTTPQAQRDRMRQFVNRHWDHALAAERATGIPAKFIVAQAAHESGWGRHEIRGADGLPSHNLFGIKAGASWKGRTVDVVTTEYENGVARKVVEKFRAYSTYGEAFRDYARLLAGNPRYAPVIAAGADAGRFAAALQRSGYATDPDYAARVARAIGAVSTLRTRA